MTSDIRKDIRKHTNPIRAQHSQGFFKTNKGEYGEGDIFLGLTVPEQRTIARTYRDLTEDEILDLLHSSFHEERLIALFILVDQFQRGDTVRQKHLYELYLANTQCVNNWDLVDSSAHKIVGEFLKDKDRSILYTLAHSENLWERRISIISTFAFIRDDDFEDALSLSETLVHDKHDLIQKAVGWVLREVGKKDMFEEEVFLKRHYRTMPRTMLRYAIERFPEGVRQTYLRGTVR